MIRFNGIYAKVWEVEKFANYTKVKMSTSRKDKKNDTYVNSTWFASFVGEAHKKDITVGESVKITGGVEKAKYKETYTTNVIVYDFERKDSAPEGFTEMSEDIPF